MRRRFAVPVVLLGLGGAFAGGYFAAPKAGLDLNKLAAGLGVHQGTETSFEDVKLEQWLYPGSHVVTRAAAEKSTIRSAELERTSIVADAVTLSSSDSYEDVLAFYLGKAYALDANDAKEWAKKAWQGGCGSSSRTLPTRAWSEHRVSMSNPRPEWKDQVAPPKPHVLSNFICYRTGGVQVTIVVERAKDDDRTWVHVVLDAVIERPIKTS